MDFTTTWVTPKELPAGWNTLQRDVDMLIEEHGLKSVDDCLNLIIRKLADAELAGVLKSLLEVFPAIERFHVTFSVLDGNDINYEIYVDTAGDHWDIEGLEEAFTKASYEDWPKNLRSTPVFRPGQDSPMNNGLPVVTIDRTTV